MAISKLAAALLSVPMVGDFDGKSVRELRLALDLTQEDASALVGVALNTWSRWERGVLQPHPLMQAHLAAALSQVRAAQARNAPQAWQPGWSRRPLEGGEVWLPGDPDRR